MNSAFTNKLIHETSPYLLQHAHNPVNWFPWGEEALEKARLENKPLLISIGYAACHWCHVMERESFENEQTAAYMNEHFINIKIDREERPDLDQIYMDAVQAIAGNGGWPLNVFCTPDTKPFFGGTYFPPVRAYNRVSWPELLQNINNAWANDREALLKQSESLLSHISKSAQFIASSDNIFTSEDCSLMADNLLQSADVLNGGFGAAPKFPQTFSLRFLLEYAYFFNDDRAKKHAIHSLKQLIFGGIYDHLGGGMSRYSTDDIWLVPHFEKMLYDNALLLTLLSDAFRFTRDPDFEFAINKTTDFIINELKDSHGGFYAALDADSEGEEGKFYVWTKAEIINLLGDQAEVFCNWYGVSESGNWEGNNILNISSSKTKFLEEHNLDQQEFEKIIFDGNQKLKSARNKRKRPQTDDKIILSWNALLLSAFCRCYAATGDIRFKEEAFELSAFITRAFFRNGNWMHTYKNGAARHPAFLDDYANLAEAYLLMQEISGDQSFLDKTLELQAILDRDFLLSSGYYAFTGVKMDDILFRKTETYDGAMPSGNSTAARNLHYLGHILDRSEWVKRSENMLGGVKSLVLKFPGSFGLWASLFIYKATETKELVITGPISDEKRVYILKKYIPNCIIQSSLSPMDYPLLKGKAFTEKTYFYLCRGQACLPPVTSPEALLQLII